MNGFGPVFSEAAYRDKVLCEVQNARAFANDTDQDVLVMFTVRNFLANLSVFEATG